MTLKDSLYRYAPRDWIGSDVTIFSNIADAECWTVFHHPHYYWHPPTRRKRQLDEQLP
jgi:hypothetical protein